MKTQLLHGLCKPTRSRKGQPNGYAHIVAHIKDAVMKGALNPGARLPTRREMIRQFRTTPVTVQHAMDVLVQHGYIRSDGARGTFVARFPPHVSHYAMAFPSSEWHPYHQFYVALHREAERLQGPGRRITMFHSITGHTDEPDYQRLLEHVRSHQVGGIIFTFAPFMLKGSPLLEEPGIPRVVIRSPLRGAAFPEVYPDVSAFLPRAMEYLAGRGRTKVALVVMAGADGTECVVKHEELAASYGLQLMPQWIQGIHPDTAPWAKQVMLAVFRVQEAQRPDALIVADDNLVEAATEGLAASGVRVPQDVEVVAHTNFPWPTKSCVPVTRLGFDIRRLVAVCIERINQQRRGEAFPMMTWLPPLFEEEMAVTAEIAMEMGRVSA